MGLEVRLTVRVRTGVPSGFYSLCNSWNGRNSLNYTCMHRSDRDANRTSIWRRSCGDTTIGNNSQGMIVLTNFCKVHTRNCLAGLVVKASASRAEDPGFDSRLRLVSPVSVYCGWGRKFDLQLLSQCGRKLSEQIHPQDTLACCWDVKQPANYNHTRIRKDRPELEESVCSKDASRKRIQVPYTTGGIHSDPLSPWRPPRWPSG